MLKDNVSFLILYHCHTLLPREQEGGNKAKKKKESCPWEGDNNFNRARSRNPHTSPCTNCPKTTRRSHSHAQYPAGPPARARSPSERTEVFKLPLGYPNYLLFLINQQHSSLLQDLILSCQVRGCLLRLNKGNIVAEVFRLYSKCRRWQGLWILVIILHFFFLLRKLFSHKKLAGSGHCSHRPTCCSPASLLHSRSFFLVRSGDSKQLPWHGFTQPR